jgi:hypothetical protein
MSPYSTVPGKRDAFLEYSDPIMGMRSNSSVGEASKLRHVAGAQKPQPYYT